MADQITNYKCPACAGPLHFSGTKGMMECDYCGSTYSVDEIDAAMAEADAKAEQAKADADAATAQLHDEWSVTEEEWNGAGMKTYSCPSCGASLVCEDTMAASSCPYCGNPTVVPGQFSGMLKPDYVIPFKHDKNAAVEALKKHYGKKFLLPSAFKTANHLEEVKGVYVPFWLYDGTAYGDAVYDCTKTDKKRVGNEEITTEEIYVVERKCTMKFEKIPADASTKMSDSLMDSIEPYDYKDLKPFSKAYLSGYLADKYDVTAEENEARAIDRAKNSTKNAMMADVTKDYSTTIPKKENIRIDEGKASYAMMPVWLLNTKWKDQNYMFAMNGQTGKMVGDLPINYPKFILTLVILTAIIMGVFCGLLNCAVSLGVIITIVVVGITGIVLYSTMKDVSKASVADEYVTKDSTKFTHRRDTFIKKNITKKPIESK